MFAGLVGSVDEFGEAVQKWSLRGVVPVPHERGSWRHSHAALPTPLTLSDSVLRLYIQFRDERGIGRVGFVDVSRCDPTRVIRISQHPVLDVGSAGMFDAHGVAASCVIRDSDETIWLYYVGFERCVDVRYRLFTGLARSQDPDGPFVRHSNIPILDRVDRESLFRTAPWVTKPSGGRPWVMWYVGGDSFDSVCGKQVPNYSIKAATSVDGVNWSRSSHSHLDFNSESEHGLGRPIVRYANHGLEMFYSIRQLTPLSYVLGCASSSDGSSWERQDEKVEDINRAMLPTEGSCEYLALANYEDRTFAFVNGQDFGATGIFVFEEEI